MSDQQSENKKKDNIDRIQSIVIAIVGIITFLLLTMPVVDEWFCECVPDYILRIITKALIIFIILYITNRLLELYCD